MKLMALTMAIMATSLSASAKILSCEEKSNSFSVELEIDQPNNELSEFKIKNKDGKKYEFYIQNIVSSGSAAALKYKASQIENNVAQEVSIDMAPLIEDQTPIQIALSGRVQSIGFDQTNLNFSCTIDGPDMIYQATYAIKRCLTGMAAAEPVQVEDQDRISVYTKNIVKDQNTCINPFLEELNLPPVVVKAADKAKLSKMRVGAYVKMILKAIEKQIGKPLATK